MSTKIMLPNTINTAYKKMCADFGATLVAKLAEKYNFDVQEATIYLEMDNIVFENEIMKNDSKKGSKKNKAVASNNDKPKVKVKRGLSGYNLFSIHMRPTIVAELTANLDNDAKPKSNIIMTALGEHWTALNDLDKALWNDKAKALKSNSSDSD